MVGLIEVGDRNLHKKQLYQLVGPSSLSALKNLQIDIQFMYDFGAAEWKLLTMLLNVR